MLFINKIVLILWALASIAFARQAPPRGAQEKDLIGMLKSPDQQVRFDAILAIKAQKNKASFKALKEALKLATHPKERRLLFRAIGYKARENSEQVRFLWSMLKEREVHLLDKRLVLEALFLTGSKKLDGPSSKILFDLSLYEKQAAREASLLLASFESALTPHQEKSLAKGVLGSSELQVLCKSLPINLLNKNEYWQLNGHCRKYLLHRLEKQKIIKKLPSAFWQLKTAANVDNQTLGLFLSYVSFLARNKVELELEESTLLLLAKANKGIKVTQHALEVYFYSRLKKAPQKEVFKELEAFAKDTKQKQLSLAAHRLLAQYASGPFLSLPLSALLKKEASLPFKTHVLRGFLKAKELSDEALLKGLNKVLAEKNEENIRLAIYLLGRLKLPLDFERLFELFRSHSADSQYLIRLAILETLAKKGEKDAMTLYRRAAEDKVPLVASRAKALYLKDKAGHLMAGVGEGSRAKTAEAKEKEDEKREASSQAREKARGPHVLVVKTNKGSMRLRFFEDVPSGFYVFLRSFLKTGWQKASFQEDDINSILLKMPNIPSFMSHDSLRLARKNNIILHKEKGGAPRGLTFLKEDAPRQYLSAAILGEILSGEEVLSELLPEDRVLKITREYMVAIP